jgi:small subunit ribosomal protein S2
MEVPEIEQGIVSTAKADPESSGSHEPVTMKALLEAGVHFGHQTRRWDPHMKRFIFTSRNGIHIIDLQKTLTMLERAVEAMRTLVTDGGDVLFVGTKKQAQDAVKEEAERSGMHYVNQRWLGGTLTNFHTIRARIDYMLELEQKQEKGLLQNLIKKERLKVEENLTRLQKYFGGLRNMRKVPSAMFVVDLEKENICIAEARRMGVKLFAVVDSNCNPDLVDYPVPSNDDAIRSIKLMTGCMADAILAGLTQRQSVGSENDSDMVSEVSDTPYSEGTNDIVFPTDNSGIETIQGLVTEEVSDPDEEIVDDVPVADTIETTDAVEDESESNPEDEGDIN